MLALTCYNRRAGVVQAVGAKKATRPRLKMLSVHSLGPGIAIKFQPHISDDFALLDSSDPTFCARGKHGCLQTADYDSILREFGPEQKRDLNSDIPR